MQLTKDYKETIKERAQRDDKFAIALLDEAMTLFLNGEAELAKRICSKTVRTRISKLSLISQVSQATQP